MLRQRPIGKFEVGKIYYDVGRSGRTTHVVIGAEQAKCHSNAANRNDRSDRSDCAGSLCLPPNPDAQVRVDCGIETYAKTTRLTG